MSALGYLLMFAGGVGMFVIDILSTIWLYNNHGIGWVIASWAFFIPLFIIPFVAGLGVAFVVCVAAYALGAFLADET